MSRAGAESNLGTEIASQILYQPRAIGITAIVLFAVGFATLMLADIIDPSEQDESLIGGLLFLTWLLTWAAAAATGTIGIALGAMRLVSRHRMRTA